MDATMIAGIDIVETIKSSGVGNGYFARWASQQAEVNESKTRENDISVFLSGLSVFLIDLTNALVLTVAAWSIIHGRTTVGLILVLQTLIQKLTAPAQGAVVGQQRYPRLCRFHPEGGGREML